MAPDGAFINALMLLASVAFLIGVGVVFLYLHFQKNLLAQRLQNETLKNAHQNELLRSNFQAQEEERKSIAQDVHDELGAVLAIMRMNLVMLERQAGDSTAGFASGVQNVRGLAETALASVRHISHRLMPPQLESFGLIKTIESVIGQINGSGNLTVQLVAAEPLQLPWPVSLGLYRIIMELVSNTVKHSGGDEAAITLFADDNKVVCEYSDNGRGLQEQASPKGLGHKSIEGRVSALRGHTHYKAGVNGGFFVEIQLPLLPSDRA